MLELEILEETEEITLFEELDELEDELTTLLELTLELTPLLEIELEIGGTELDEVTGGT